MATLVSLEDFKAYLQYEPADQDPTLQAILNAVEDHLASKTGETFGAADTVTQEAHSGDGTRNLYVRRPMSSVTTIEVSATSDAADPDDTIATDDVRIDPENDRHLVRVQNGGFPLGLLNIFVTYEALANLPTVAIEAVKEGAALVHRIRGSEHVRSESLGDLGSQVLEIDRRFRSLPMWEAAVAQLRHRAALLA